ncbi:hypothetical protein K491DRAFT_699402 [Lophiostoma macrostomum CBS 122681]|uniref:Uncharacterized protein n=1 Tax=Lophiostoma macrostomum CBS 122681 TaxID=1314788 RepID=A0A6A6SIV2_9PLEO|nr:hypothetical protein K491DRAFT_699402 [Lophiostoma macrostomum CBS 122681]
MAPVLLPTPLAVDTLSLGQLISDPLDPSSSSFLSPTKPTSAAPQIQRNYKDVISHDDEGHFVSSLAGHSLSSRSSLLLVQAEQMEYHSLDQPSRAFTTLQQDTDAQSYLINMAKRDRLLYYITGLQKLHNPTFKRGVVKEGSLTEAKPDNSKLRLPLHTRRDSAMDVQDSSTDVVSAVEIRKVRCRVGSPAEPHLLEDIGYEWTYHRLDAEGTEQLSIGLGKPLVAADIHGLAGMVGEEDFTDESLDGGSDEEVEREEEGMAGFSAHRGRGRW